MLIPKTAGTDRPNNEETQGEKRTMIAMYDIEGLLNSTKMVSAAISLYLLHAEGIFIQGNFFTTYAADRCLTLSCLHVKTIQRDRVTSASYVLVFDGAIRTCSQMTLSLSFSSHLLSFQLLWCQTHSLLIVVQ